MKIYTKTGDAGQTSLAGGRRVAKNHPQVEVYGQLDELNAHLGMAAADLDLPETEALRTAVEEMQRCLFKTGNLYAFDYESGKEFNLPFITEGDIEFLEKEIDKLEADLPPLTDFILPGGAPQCCRAHIARTVCRRAERVMTAAVLPPKEAGKELLAKTYINRLSDFLFMLARWQAKIRG